MTDPFRARRKPSAPADDAATLTAPPASLPSRAELEDMTKAQLQGMARARGVDDSGTKTAIIDRLVDES